MSVATPTRVKPAARRLSGTRIRDLLLVGLTVSSGALDAISFIALGKVFTAFMTGNFVFLGLGLAGAGGPPAGRVLMALAIFAAGVFVAMRIVKPTSGSGIWPRRVSVTVGCVLAIEVVAMVVWMATSGQPGTGSGYVLTALLALAMGLQSSAVASLAVRGVFTTAATATVIYLMNDVAAPAGSREPARLAGVLIALLAGAVGGGLLLVHAPTYALVLPVLATGFVVVVASRTFHGRA